MERKEAAMETVLQLKRSSDRTESGWTEESLMVSLVRR